MSIVLYLLVFIIYLATLSPAIFWMDSGETISGCYLLGVSHSPGYATYNTLGKLFTYIPAGDISFRVNLLSTFCGAISVFIFYFLLLKIIKNEFVSFLISLIFAFSYTLWFYSGMAEVYSIYYLLGISLIYLLIISDEKKDTRLFYFSFFIISLCIFFHLYFIIFAPAVIYFLIKNKLLNFKTIILFFFVFFIITGTNIYLPLRSASNIILDFGNSEKFSNLLKIITFRMGVTHPEIILTFSKFLTQIKVIIYFFSRQISILYFIFFAVGFFVLFKKNRELFFVLSVLFFPPMLPFILFDLEIVDMWNLDYALIFSYIIFFLFFASGIIFLQNKFKKLIVIILLLILLNQFYYGIKLLKFFVLFKGFPVFR